jgi:hypothetical protein
MRTKPTWISVVVVMVAVGFAMAGTPFAQTPSPTTSQSTSTTDVRNFEVISVDGNKLVVRDQKGTEEYTVPDDFRFTVDGKKVSVSELKPGMKGTATITTTTTVKPVVVTEVREGDVLRASPMSVTVRTADGTRRFTQEELDARGVQIIVDGRPTRVGDLKRGDKLTATIVTQGPPTVLTEREVQATLDESKAEPATTQPVTTAAPAQPATQSMAPAPSPQPSAVQPATQPAETSGLGMTWYVVIAVLVLAALFFYLRKRNAT